MDSLSSVRIDLHRSILSDGSEGRRGTGCYAPAFLWRLLSFKEHMQTTRWLLPFIHTLDLQAQHQVLQIAEQRDATLVLLSLLVSNQEHKLCLEQLQTSRDFFNVVCRKALQQQIVVECYEVLTNDVNDVPECIASQIQKLDCQSIILSNAGGRLPDEALRQMLIHPPASLVFLTKN